MTQAPALPVPPFPFVASEAAASAASAGRTPASLAALIVTVMLAGCAAPKAVVYTEETPERRAKAWTTLQSCEQRARDTVGVNTGSEAIRRDAGRNGAVAAGGVFVGAAIRKSADIALTAITAGAVGVATTLTRGAFDWRKPDDVYEEHVKICMKRRGFEVAGWR